MMKTRMEDRGRRTAQRRASRRSSIFHPPSPILAPSHADAAAHGDAAIATGRRSGSLAALLTGHVLQDGEVVLLMLKPSLWYVLLSSLRFIAVALILMIAAKLLDPQLPGQNFVYQETGLFVITGRLVWAMLQWMGQLYLLTDLRIVRVAGVFSIDLFDCPLRKVARTRILRSMRERLTRLGTIEVIPLDPDAPVAYWMMIAKPVEVNEQIVAAIRKAKSGCG